MSERDPFRVEGVGCWCDGNRTLYEIRLMGHTVDCTVARRGWEANYRRLSAMDQQIAADREAGRQLREAAEALIEAGE